MQTGSIWFKKMSEWPLTCQRSVFKQYDSKEDLSVFYKAVTSGCFGCLNTPRNFREKLYTQKTDLLLVTKFARGVEPTVFMPSTSLEMHQNRFRSGLRPGPNWGSLQRSLRPLTGGEGARCLLPKNSTPSSALPASAIGYAVSSPNTPENKS